MTKMSCMGMMLSLALASVPLSASAWTVVDEPVDMTQIPEEFQDITWVKMTPHRNAARENLYGVTSRDNLAAVAFVQANRAGFRPAAAGNQARIDHEKDFGPFLGVAYNIPVDLLPENSEAWEGLLEAGIVERVEETAVAEVAGEEGLSVLALYEALELEVATLRADFLQQQEDMASRIAELTEQVSAGEEGLGGEVDALWEEFQAVRNEMPELIDLDPLRQSISDIALAVDAISEGNFTGIDGAELRIYVDQQLRTFSDDIASLNARITAEAEARVAGDAALLGRIDGVLSSVSTLQGRVNELSTQFSELAMPDISGIEADVGAVSERLGALEERFNGLEYATPDELAAAEAEISTLQTQYGELFGRLGSLESSVAGLRSDFESAETHPLRGFYAPLGLSEWYEENPGVGYFTAAGLALIVLAMLIVVLRGIFPGREGRLAKAHEQQLNGDGKRDTGLAGKVDSHEGRLTVLEERVGTVEDKAEVLEQLALQDLDFDEDNADLRDLQPGEENAVVWKVSKKGDATRYYLVTIGRLEDTPSGQVFTDIPRKKGGEPVNTPFAIATLELKILKAINDGRLEPVLLNPSLNGSADASRHVN